MVCHDKKASENINPNTISRDGSQSVSQMIGASKRAEVGKYEGMPKVTSDFKEFVQMQKDKEFLTLFISYDRNVSDRKEMNDGLWVKLYFLERLVSEGILLEQISLLSGPSIKVWMNSDPRFENG